jgi:hypothetical protein
MSHDDWRDRIRYRVNSTAHSLAGLIRYVETRFENSSIYLDHVGVEENGFVRAVLRRALTPVSLRELVQVLLEIGLTEPAAREVVNELISSQVLISEVHPAATGCHPREVLTSAVRTVASTSDTAKVLDALAHRLDALDASGLGATPARYHELADELARLPAAVNRAQLFRVELIKPCDAVLGADVVNGLARALGALCRVGVARQDARLDRFRAAFVGRYGRREIPLVAALDRDVGIGFEPSDAADQHLPWGARETLLLRKLEATLREQADELSLSESDLAGLPLCGELPDAFAVFATILAPSPEAVAAGQFRVLVVGPEGPSGVRPLGRLCHADNAIHQAVQAHLRAEEALRPDIVFAEIAHLPAGRAPELLLRPVLRKYEIPYLGRSGVSPDRQIPIDDLLISVRDNRVVLRSSRLGREVQPRSTSSHQFDDAAQEPVYAFLEVPSLRPGAGAHCRPPGICRVSLLETPY